MAERNVIISGMPRSGTTLLTAIMDAIPDAVALNEPKWQYDTAAKARENGGAEEFARWLVEDFGTIRKRLLTGVPVPERRRADGSAVTNYYQLDEKGAASETFKVIPFTRPGLSDGFTLAMKHNGLYLGVLPQIVQTGVFKVVMIIKHPVDVLYSWTRAPIPPAKGQLPGASLYWDEMRGLTASDMPLLEKQVGVYDLICKRIAQVEKNIELVLYEDLVRDPVPFCERLSIAPNAAQRLVVKQKANIPDPERQRLSEAIKKYGKYYLRYYR